MVMLTQTVVESSGPGLHKLVRLHNLNTSASSPIATAHPPCKQMLAAVVVVLIAVVVTQRRHSSRGTYLAGIPLHGFPGTPLPLITWPVSIPCPFQQFTSHFHGEEGFAVQTMAAIVCTHASSMCHLWPQPIVLDEEPQLVEKMRKKTERSTPGAQTTTVAKVDRVSVLGRNKNHQFRQS